MALFALYVAGWVLFGGIAVYSRVAVPKKDKTFFFSYILMFACFVACRLRAADMWGDSVGDASTGRILVEMLAYVLLGVLVLAAPFVVAKMIRSKRQRMTASQG